MVVEKIDLYSYFNISKPENAKGILTVYALDNYAEHSAKRVRPAILVIPGGGYEFVSSREGESIAVSYLAHGFQAFVIDYSVAPNFRYPTAFREAAMAMIFIRENAKKYHVDPDQVAAIGFSAGGHLCGCLGNMFNSADISDLRNCDFVRPTAVILSYPVSVYGEHGHNGSFINLTNGNEELSNKLALDKCVSKLSSPAFLWHTANDNVVPVIGTLDLARKYAEYNVPFAMHIFGEGPHGISTATEEVNAKNDHVAVWIDLSISWFKERGFNIFS
jgi:acetyl esterase/lipase